MSDTIPYSSIYDWLEEYRRSFILPSEELIPGYQRRVLNWPLSEDSGLVTIPAYDWLSMNDISSLLPPFRNDGLGIKDSDPVLSDLQSEQLVKYASPDSTKTEDINALNRAYRAKLMEDTDSFVYSLIRTDFEDGMENYLTEEVNGYIQENAFATYSWLNHIYANNQDNEDVIAGVLRIIAMDVEEEDYDDLLPIVKAGLCDYGAKVQEAALMVIEKWRTKNCLTALQTSNIQSSWLREYAKRVEKELIDELNNVG